MPQSFGISADPREGRQNDGQDLLQRVAQLAAFPHGRGAQPSPHHPHAAEADARLVPNVPTDLNAPNGRAHTPGARDIAGHVEMR